MMKQQIETENSNNLVGSCFLELHFSCANHCCPKNPYYHFLIENTVTMELLQSGSYHMAGNACGVLIFIFIAVVLAVMKIYDCCYNACAYRSTRNRSGARIESHTHNGCS